MKIKTAKISYEGLQGDSAKICTRKKIFRYTVSLIFRQYAPHTCLWGIGGLGDSNSREQQVLREGGATCGTGYQFWGDGRRCGSRPEPEQQVVYWGRLALPQIERERERGREKREREGRREGGRRGGREGERKGGERKREKKRKRRGRERGWEGGRKKERGREGILYTCTNCKYSIVTSNCINYTCMYMYMYM